MTDEHKDFAEHIREQARDGYGVAVQRSDTEQARNITRPMNAWIRSTRADDEAEAFQGEGQR
jgi:hypothetical protein